MINLNVFVEPTKYLAKEGTSAQKKQIILRRPSLDIQEILVQDTSLDILTTLARYTTYPEILRKLYYQSSVLDLKNQYTPTEIIDNVFDTETHLKYVTMDVIVVHPNVSTRVLEALEKINYPQTVGKIAKMRLTVRRYTSMLPNRSELSFLLTSTFITND